jgi:hypothetical protein
MHQDKIKYKNNPEESAKIRKAIEAHVALAEGERTINEAAIRACRRAPSHMAVFQADGAQALQVPVVHPSQSAVTALHGRPRFPVHSGWNVGLNKETMFISFDNGTHGQNFVATTLMLMVHANAHCDAERGSKTGTEQARVSTRPLPRRTREANTCVCRCCAFTSTRAEATRAKRS